MIDIQLTLEEISLHVEFLLSHALLIPNFLLEVFRFHTFWFPREERVRRIKFIFDLRMRIARRYFLVRPSTKREGDRLLPGKTGVFYPRYARSSVPQMVCLP